MQGCSRNSYPVRREHKRWTQRSPEKTPTDQTLGVAVLLVERTGRRFISSSH